MLNPSKIHAVEPELYANGTKKNSACIYTYISVNPDVVIQAHICKLECVQSGKQKRKKLLL